MNLPNEKWSYSSLKTFEQCPKKYYHLKIAQDVPNISGIAAVYGKQFHKAAEEYVLSNGSTTLPKEFAYAEKLLDTLISRKGDTYCELELGVKLENDQTVSCDFNDDNYWWHGIADYVNVHERTCISLDYKTGKSARYADTAQLDAVAMGLFLLFPELDTIKSGLVFVVSGDFIRKTHYRENLDSYIQKFLPQLEKLADTKASGMWNPIAGPLCGWCPVSTCEHWSDRG